MFPSNQLASSKSGILWCSGNKKEGKGPGFQLKYSKSASVTFSPSLDIRESSKLIQRLTKILCLINNFLHLFWCRDVNWHSHGDLLPTENFKSAFSFLASIIFMRGTHFKSAALTLAMLKQFSTIVTQKIQWMCYREKSKPVIKKIDS